MYTLGNVIPEGTKKRVVEIIVIKLNQIILLSQLGVPSTL